jgi:hypothetical protein
MIGRYVNDDELVGRKGLEGSDRGLILRYYPGICLEGLRKNTKCSVRIADLRGEILTRDLPNTKQECEVVGHHLKNLFSTIY